VERPHACPLAVRCSAALPRHPHLCCGGARPSPGSPSRWGRPASHPPLAGVRAVLVSAPEQGDNLGLRELARMRRTEPVHRRFRPCVWHHLQNRRWQPELTVLGGFPARETDLLSPAAPAQRQENGVLDCWRVIRRGKEPDGVGMEHRLPRSSTSASTHDGLGRRPGTASLWPWKRAWVSSGRRGSPRGACQASRPRGVPCVHGCRQPTRRVVHPIPGQHPPALWVFQKRGRWSVRRGQGPMAWSACRACLDSSSAVGRAPREAVIRSITSGTSTLYLIIASRKACAQVAL